MMSLNQNNVTENNNIPMDADPMFSADNKSNLPVRDKDGESLEFLGCVRPGTRRAVITINVINVSAFIA